MTAKKHKFGIAVNWFDQQLLRDIKAAGFDCIMSWVGADFEKIVKGAEEVGLGFPVAHLDCKENAAEGIRRAYECGIEVVVLHTTDLTRGELAELIKLAQEYKMRIALENRTPEDDKRLDKLLDEFKTDTLGFCYDCAHHYLYNPTNDVLGKHRSRCIAVHLSDNNLDYDAHLLPFDGMLDFEKIMNDMKEVPADTYILEVFLQPTDKTPHPTDTTPQAEFLRVAMARVRDLES